MSYNEVYTYSIPQSARCNRALYEKRLASSKEQGDQLRPDLQQMVLRNRREKGTTGGEKGRH